jgi:hypothetical protein
MSFGQYGDWRLVLLTCASYAAALPFGICSSEKKLTVAIGMGFEGSTSPATVVLDSKLYLFWTGSGYKGAWYAAFDGSSWESLGGIISIQSNMSVMPETTVAVSAFNGQIYLFYSDGNGSGICYTTYTPGSNWTPIVSLKQYIPHMTLQTSTSPSVCTLDQPKNLNLYWINVDNEISCATLSNGNWNFHSTVAGQAVLAGTSTCSTAYNDIPYVVYARADQGIYYSEGITYEMGPKRIDAFNQSLRNGQNFTVTIRNDDVVAYFSNRKTGLKAQSYSSTGTTIQTIADLLTAVPVKSESSSNVPLSSVEIITILSFVQVAMLGFGYTVAVTYPGTSLLPIMSLSFASSL